MDMQLNIEIMFCAVELERAGKKATAGEVSKRCGGIVTRYVAAKHLTYLWQMGLLHANKYQHRAASGKREAIIATRYSLKDYDTAHIFYDACVKHWQELHSYYVIVKAA